ncbi:MAG: hypothetical protein GY732_07735 [Gammaproteobacteria bacterium]|nr:hypothetical protein [Gammaproteobacteria bacterium]
MNQLTTWPLTQAEFSLDKENAMEKLQVFIPPGDMVEGRVRTRRILEHMVAVCGNHEELVRLLEFLSI